MELSNKPYLTTRSINPENQETPIKFLKTETIPTTYFFRRNHFQYPTILNDNFFLPITGQVKMPIVFQYSQIVQMETTAIKCFLECAGNKRSKFNPPVFGEQWEEGAISQGEWKGISLSCLLEITGIAADAREVVFVGYDYGKQEDIEHHIPFARSLPLEKAIHPDTIIAYEYNGRPLTYKHGFPFRLIVPGWYGMASVKWLKKIILIDDTFKGPFQTDDYVYYPKLSDPYPVTMVNVNSLIQKPLDYEIIDEGVTLIEGIAWSGESEVTNVDISFNGQQWVDAILIGETLDKTNRWTKWKFHWNAPKGEHTIYCRASDSKGRKQPLEPMWNKKGYGYNAITKIRVKVK
ncbi:sulfite oxidase [Anaerobacillus alkaliphilus]|uniref:Sulfite oxidase n=1 Tax=Anaerobacillus alkaliphilus TaxID=1548597 RepID=A0A4Q0VN06_9BACI|nr:sulfite oxidase [Anaerobacillus alkaliphilus]RXI95662.1 sulfite oxidase [Anaerobacillus alkaliphilus]